MDSASPLPYNLKTIAIRLSVQVLLFGLCLAIAKYLVLNLTGSGLFENVIASSGFDKLAWLKPQSQVWYDFLPSLTVVLAILPLLFGLQLLNGHVCLSPYEKKHASYVLPLVELFTLPVMIFLAWVAALEVLINLAKGVPLATIKAGFPGWSEFCDWLFWAARKKIPALKVPVGAIFNTMVFAWLILMALTAMADCNCAFWVSVALGPIFGTVCGMSLAFSARSWDVATGKDKSSV